MTFVKCLQNKSVQMRSNEYPIMWKTTLGIKLFSAYFHSCVYVKNLLLKIII